jgi:hypothetical protein
MTPKPDSSLVGYLPISLFTMIYIRASRRIANSLHVLLHTDVHGFAKSFIPLLELALEHDAVTEIPLTVSLAASTAAVDPLPDVCPTCECWACVHHVDDVAHVPTVPLLPRLTACCISRVDPDPDNPIDVIPLNHIPSRLPSHVLTCTTSFEMAMLSAKDCI